MIFAVVTLVLALIGSLFYAFKRGRSEAELVAKVDLLETKARSQRKVLHALSEWIGKEAELRSLLRDISATDSLSELHGLYSKITSPRR